jgi:carotenoid cleavage dioxygenase-like enzyme
VEIRFPDIPLYKGWGHPYRVESTVCGLELIQGSAPAGLNGAWYKVGPDRQFPPMHGDDVFTDGEGMAHVWRFADGKVDYRSRWVRSARFVAQEKAGRSLFGEYRNPFNKDPLAVNVHGGTANTSALYLGGKLLITKEDDMPYQIDPDTLETIGRYTYDGRVTAQRLSAHHKTDMVNDTVLNFSHQARGDGTPDTAFYEIDRDGEILDEIWFKAPFAGHVHDFAHTEHYVVFAFHPLVTELETVKRTGRYYEWQPERGMKIAVLKRHGSAEEIRWFDGPAVTYGHMVNAFEDGSKINFDVLLAEGNFYAFIFPGRDGVKGKMIPQMLRRIVINLARNEKSFEIQPARKFIIELAKIDDRFFGYPYRHMWAVAGRPPKLDDNGAIDLFNSEADIARYDVVTGEEDRWEIGPDSSCQEPVFVPRTPDSPEGDGWLLVITNRLKEGRSEVMAFDALRLAAGPIATWAMQVRVRSTFHGTWVPRETFRTHRYAMSRVQR